MKVFALVLSVFLVGVSSVPQHQLAVGKQAQGRLITDTITNAINEASNKIREAGLDPLVVESLQVEYSLPVPAILRVQAQVVDFLFSGLSNIAIHRINYNVLSSRLTFDISLPELGVSIGEAVSEATVLGIDIGAGVSGQVAVKQLRVTGEIRVSISIISGIAIRSMTFNLGLGGIESNLNVNVNGKDLSDKVNDLIGTSLPALLQENKSDLEKLMENIAWRVVESVLN